jgi:hypothetical protein
MFMTRKPSEQRKKQSVAGALDAETLYKQYLQIRSERDKSRNESEYPVTELKKANRGDILT